MAKAEIILGESSGGYSGYTEKYAQSWTAGNLTQNITLESGKTYLLLVFGSSGSSQAYNKYDSVVVNSGGAITKIDTLLSANSNAAGTWFTLKTTSSTVNITIPAAGAVRVFLAE